MHEILDGKDVVLAERLLNDRVVGEGDALLVDLAVSALVDQLADGLKVGLAAGEKMNSCTNACSKQKRTRM